MRILRNIVLVALLATSSHAGIETQLLAGGKESAFSWSLVQILSPDEDIHLIVVIQNTGSKWMDTEGLDASFFSLKDTNGKEIKIHRATGFTGVAYNGITVGHLVVDGPISPSANHDFFLREKKDSFSSASFVAKGVQFAEPRKTQIHSETGTGPPAACPDSNPHGNKTPQSGTEGSPRSRFTTSITSKNETTHDTNTDIFRFDDHIL